MLCKLYKNHLQVNATQIINQQKKKQYQKLDITITSYTIIYIKINGRDNTTQAKSYVFIVVPQQNSRNVVVSRGENSSNNNIDDSNKTNNNKKMMITVITVVIIIII